MDGSVKASLESAGVNVLIEYEEHNKDDEVKEGAIVSQDQPQGNILKKGDTIIFKVVKIITAYPDFVAEDYSVEGVQQFCDDNGVKLDITYEETDKKRAGTIISQSRTAGTKVMSGVTLRIVVAKEVTKVEKPEEPKKENTEETTKPSDSTTDKEENKTDNKVDNNKADNDKVVSE